MTGALGCDAARDTVVLVWRMVLVVGGCGAHGDLDALSGYGRLSTGPRG